MRPRPHGPCDGKNAGPLESCWITFGLGFGSLVTGLMQASPVNDLRKGQDGARIS